VHFLFRGLRRGSGEPVIGQLFAPNEDAVHGVLDAHAIVVEVVGPEDADLFPPALQAALGEAGLRVRFNQMPKVKEGHGVWILERERIGSRVMQLARNAVRGDSDRQPALRRIEELLDTFYGDRQDDPAAPAVDLGRFATAEEVRAEMRRLMASINRLERELISIRARPAGDVEPRRPGRRSSAPRDRTRDDVLREIFEHNLELNRLTRDHGILPATDE
jgi:hypothetical protein